MNKSLVILLIFVMFSVVPTNLYSQGENKEEPALMEAMKLSKKGKFTQAIEKIQLLIKQHDGDKNLVYHLHLGFVYFKAKQYDNSLSEFNQVLAIDKDFAVPYYHVGLIYEAMALVEKDKAEKVKYKKTALENWKEYLRCSSMPEDKTKEYKFSLKKKKEHINFANRHIKELTEELVNE
jgi:tetratricopeptide (TPR) repeat protein